MPRTNLYGKSQIILGDRTSHGGVVISGSLTSSWYGVPIVRKGDYVTCPRCSPHIFKIAEGLENCTDTNAALPMATEGHKTTCGATLIAKTAADSDAPEDILALVSNIQKKMLQEENDSHGVFFEVVSETTGKPLVNYPYEIELRGEIKRGHTDQYGHTQAMTADDFAEAKLHVYDYEPRKNEEGEAE